MTGWRVEAGLAAVVLVFSLVAAHRWRGTALVAAPPAPMVPSPPSIPPSPDADALDEVALAATEQNPFRLSRTPSEVVFTPRSAGLAVTPTSAPAFRGTLVLKGIVGGPPWQAVIDGIPGQPPGTVVKAGSTFDKLSIRSVSRDTVVVQAPDTIWRLTLVKGNQ